MNMLFAVFIVITVLLFIAWYFVRKNKRTTYCHYHPDLRDQVAIVTGANCGIGKETARELAERGATVILACRSVERGEAAAADIRASVNGADVIVRRLDLSSLKNVAQFAARIRTEVKCVDILVNNAGVGSPLDPFTVDGFDTTFGINHLGPFLLTYLLADMIEKSRAKRIVMVSSTAATNGRVVFNDNGELIGLHSVGLQLRYCNTKLMNCLFAQEITRRWRAKGITAFSVSPGIVATNIARYMFSTGPGRWFIKPFINLMLLMAKTPVEGCQTVLYCAVAPGIERLSGEFFEECAPRPLNKKLCSEDVARQLWNYSVATISPFL